MHDGATQHTYIALPSDTTTRLHSSQPNTSQHIARHRKASQGIATPHNTTRCDVLHLNTSQHLAMRRNPTQASTRQCIATQLKTNQHVVAIHHDESNKTPRALTPCTATHDRTPRWGGAGAGGPSDQRAGGSRATATSAATRTAAGGVRTSGERARTKTPTGERENPDECKPGKFEAA